MGRIDLHPLHNTETSGLVEPTVVEVELLVIIRGASDVMLCSSC
jgi:hypothetical protein